MLNVRFSLGITCVKPKKIQTFPTLLIRLFYIDMKAGGFWTPGVTAFFDVRVTHVNSRSNQGKHTATIFKEQENEKRKYNQRVMDDTKYKNRFSEQHTRQAKSIAREQGQRSEKKYVQKIKRF